MNIFVRNLSHEVREGDLRDLFAAYGEVATVTLVGDTDDEPLSMPRPKGYVSNRESRGYAYVDMPNQPEALAAIVGAQGQQVRGLAVTIVQALPMEHKKSKSK